MNDYSTAISRQNEKLLTEVTTLSEQVEKLTKDAERYRWLRSGSTGPSQIWELLSDDCQPPILTLKCMGDLDAAIDAAMQEDKL